MLDRAVGRECAADRVTNDRRRLGAGLRDQVLKPGDRRARVQPARVFRRFAKARQVRGDDPVALRELRNYSSPLGRERAHPVQRPLMILMR